LPETGRWLSICRRLAPLELRERVFDPAVHDLALGRALRAARAGTEARGVRARLREGFAILAIAIECRRMSWTTPAQRDGLDSHRRGDSLMTTWFHAMRQAVRRLSREPLFALVALSTLALGIGANVAVFSFVNAYLVTPLPVPASQELVRVYGHSSEFSYDTLSYPNYRDIRDGIPGLDLAAQGFARILVGADDAIEARPMELVTGNYFRVLRLTPLAGRLIETRDDVAEGSGSVVVLSETLWRSKYASDRGIVGRSIRLNGAPFEVIGVAPAGFRGTDGASTVDLWAPITMQQTLRPRGLSPLRPKGLSLDARGWGWLRTIGRLSPATTPAQLDGALAKVAVDLNARFPSPSRPMALVATPAAVLEASDRDALEPAVGLTFAFTGLLLIVTCGNLAGLMQARVLRRRREMAVRHSLGAGRGRLVSEWLAECVVLAVGGGLAGLLVARLAVLAVAASKPPVQLVGNLDLVAPFDWRVLLFAGGASLSAAILFGLWPALRASAAPLSSLLKEDAGTATGGRRGARMRRAAVLVQVAASAALLVSAALLATSLRHLQTFDPGFPTGNLAVASVDLGRLHIPGADADTFRRGALAAVRALPGVTAADIASVLPLMPGHDRMGFDIPGYKGRDGSTSIAIDEAIVGSDYFAAMGLTFLQGGSWDPSGAPAGVVINETMARRFWKDRDPVGQPMALSGKTPVALTITGVVRDSSYYQIGERPIPFVFLPAEFAKPTDYTFVARTTGPDHDMLASMSRAIASVDPRVKPYDLTTFEDARQVPLYPQKMMASAAALFGILALLLTGVGLYGVVSTSVGQRTREIGVRMALGARAGDVQAGVLGESIVLVAMGAAAGLLSGYALAGALKSWLFGVAAFDLGIYAAVAAALGALAILAAWAPARRAAKVDPVVALRM
jgi:predicted permease